MTIDDYEQAHALWLRTPGVGLRSWDDSREGIERFLSRNPGCSFVWVEGERLEGVILCGHDGRRGAIYHACVDETIRRRGVGKALVESALGALKAEGISKAALVAFTSNENGAAFWDSIGFTPRADLVYFDISLRRDNA